MHSLVRRFLPGLLALVVFGFAAAPAAAALRSQPAPRCAGSAVVEAADALIRAGRITVVQTTFAIVRVVKHEALAHERSDAARAGAR